MVDLSTQTSRLKKEINSAVQKVIDSGQFIGGSEVEEFEESLKDFLRCSHVISCANGTDALQMSLMAIGVRSGDEVIIPSFGYISAAEVSVMLGLVPVFVDVELNSYNINSELIEEAISPKTKAIIPMHLFGQTSDMSDIMKIADAHGVMVIEDGAQSMGATIKESDVHAGTIGHIGCTSFFPTKNLGCFGDGGAMFTNDDGLAIQLKMISKHGQKSKYFHEVIGINSRLDAMQASILNVKLKHLQSFIDNRKKVAAFYCQNLRHISNLDLPSEMSSANHAYNQFTIRVSSGQRDALKMHLKEKSIPSMIYYPRPLHHQKSLSQVSKYITRPRNSEQLSNEVLSLPMHTELQEDQLEYICDTIIRFFK